MEYEITQFAVETTEEVRNGMVYEVTKLHKIVVPIHIALDLETRKWNVTQGAPDVSALVHTEAVGVVLYDLAHERVVGYSH